MTEVERKAQRHLFATMKAMKGVSDEPAVLRASPSPKRPGLALASCQLIPTAITAGASRFASGPLCLHAVATTPAGPMEPIRS